MKYASGLHWIESGNADPRGPANLLFFFLGESMHTFFKVVLDVVLLLLLILRCWLAILFVCAGLGGMMVPFAIIVGGNRYAHDENAIPKALACMLVGGALAFLGVWITPKPPKNVDETNADGTEEKPQK